MPLDAFIVGNVNRNQHRKRLDLSVLYFAEWVQTRQIEDAYLYFHTLPGSSVAIDLDQLGKYCGISDRLILAQPRDVFNGASEEYVVASYRSFDVQISTTLGEGHGLTAMEGMACGIPNIGGDYAAFGEWARDAMYLVPCISEGIMPDVNQMIGGVPSKAAMIDALDVLYRDEALRATYSERGLVCVRQSKYDWKNIATQFATAIEEIV